MMEDQPEMLEGNADDQQPSTSEEAGGQVKRMSNDIARFISTGQVVISLQGACRELIDNALDAGATSIEIRTIEKGVEELQVHDNGSGIHSSNFDALCKPHSTSKLEGMDDFQSLSTFGFRGEALNALAALSTLTISTRHKTEPIATKMLFSSEGEIVERSQFARQVGTSVVVSKLFSPLPVRRKEFDRNAGKELQKMLHSVQAFCLSRPDVRFAVTNTGSGKTIKVLTTTGANSTLKDVITSLFGARSGKSRMLELKEDLPKAEIREMFGLTEEVDDLEAVYDPISISGYVSSSEYDGGQSGMDQQFVFVNKRPVDYDKLCKVATDVYKTFGKSRHCVLVLFFDLDPSLVDVNVTPDKRVVFLKNEREVCAKLRASLLHTFESVEGRVPQSPVVCTQTQPLPSGMRPKTQQVTVNEMLMTAARELDAPPQVNPNQAFSSILMAKPTRSARGSHSSPKSKKSAESESPTAKRQRTLQDFNFTAEETTAFSARTSRDGEEEDEVAEIPKEEWRESNRREMVAAASLASQQSNPAAERALFTDYSLERSFEDEAEKVPGLNSTLDDGDFSTDSYRAAASQQNRKANSKFKSPLGSQAANGRQHSTAHDHSEDGDLCDHPEPDLHAGFLGDQSDGMLVVDQSTNMNEELPAEQAEQQLSLMLRKEDFGRMLIVGQFNNAFILTRCGPHLFIVDQHASDEKFNYEHLQAHATIKSQRLLTPKRLRLGAVDETIVVNNQEIFEKNGFQFDFRQDDEIGNRVWLTALPMLSNFTFDEHDIYEMLGVLQDQSNVLYRPRKIRKIFASRACRKSVMFGASLSRQQCTSIIRHMGSMDNPWHCPHGRPTIRHLCTLKYAIESPFPFDENLKEEQQEEEEVDVELDTSDCTTSS